MDIPMDMPVDINALVERAPLLTASSDRIVIGCSGGADSVGLLALAGHCRRDVTAVYVNHGLRPDSERDFELVVSAAERFGAGAVMVEVDIDRRGSNLEARARDARFAALEQQREMLNAPTIWLAHTLDDQAETVLLAMMRGSGLAGMAGMAVRRGHIERPALGLRHAEFAGLCSHLGIATVDDPMNHDLGFDRVWVRHELLPTLNARAHRDMAAVLARQAGIVRSDHEYLERVAAAVLADANGELAVELVRPLDIVIARRVMRQFIGDPPIGGKHVEAALRVVFGECTAVELPNRRTLRRSGGILVVEPTQQLTK